MIDPEYEFALDHNIKLGVEIRRLEQALQAKTAKLRVIEEALANGARLFIEEPDGTMRELVER